MAQYSILVTHSPDNISATMAALRFAENLSNNESTLANVFFYSEGVHHANSLAAPPSDEFQGYKQWCQLHETTQCQLLVCITAALKRGIVSQQNGIETGIDSFTLTDPFEQAGLGEFFSALHECEHLVQF